MTEDIAYWTYILEIWIIIIIYNYNYLVMIYFLLYDYKINVYVKNSNIKYIFRIINKKSEIQIKSDIN